MVGEYIRINVGVSLGSSIVGHNSVNTLEPRVGSSRTSHEGSSKE